MNREQYGRIVSYMEYHMGLRPSDTAHDSQHVLRVLYMAAALGESYPVDREVIIAAALLHDIGRAYEADGRGHSEIGGDMAYDYLLGLGWKEDKAAHVRDCVYSHSLKKGLKPATQEGRILFDADKLDLTGTMGIARTLQAGVAYGEPLYSLDSQGKIDPKNRKDPSYIKQHLKRLRKTADMLYTKEAKEIAAKRLKIMEQFYEDMVREVESLWFVGQEALKDYFEGQEALEMAAKLGFEAPENGGVTIGISYVAEDQAAEDRENLYGDWLKYCAGEVRPCKHTVKDVLTYFEMRYDMAYVPMDRVRRLMYEKEIIGGNPGLDKEELVFLCVSLPYTPRNRAVIPWEKYHGLRWVEEEKPRQRICFELTTDYMDFLPGWPVEKSFQEDVLLFMGVSHEDIAKHNQRFRRYVHMLEDRGRIKSMEEFHKS